MSEKRIPQQLATDKHEILNALLRETRGFLFVIPVDQRSPFYEPEKIGDDGLECYANPN